ncbi:HEAT repeat domain-containing protein [Cyanobium sp. ATX 6F1]|uniref:HEAT repeat domain-containing protein n=1 Tax=unclassified Cyanobium TaxID=2627006 RepID=UPI0020CDC749|nr:HEAT repeat domain-containing protein [Cyanobium sp. ATX 6F1]MCP9917208.1 HEAT repeat domain-containing protein [Cyanobium sp. ATX 6F1]
MSDNRFHNIHPGLGKDEAISMLLRPLEELDLDSDRYTAAAHLINFPGEDSEAALIACLRDTDTAQAQRIARRKSVETLARLGCRQAIPDIVECLTSKDPYLVENASWALGQLGADDVGIQANLINLLADPSQSRRVIVQVLSRQRCQAALAPISAFMDADDGMLATAAITAHALISGNSSNLENLEPFLFHPNVNVRRGVIQDLMDAGWLPAIPTIGQAPVSPVFRLRGIRHLANLAADADAASFGVAPSDDILLNVIDHQIDDRPQTLRLVHRYDQPQELGALVRELYGTDFGRSYLAIATLTDQFGSSALPTLVTSFEEEGWNDYGAHYHLMHLFGRLGDPMLLPLVLDGLNNLRPQFLKSRPAAALALARLQGPEAGTALLDQAVNARSWELRYACLMAMESLGLSPPEACLSDEDRLVGLRARRCRHAVGSTG